MKRTTKAVLLSTATIAMSASLIAGATFALFTSESSTNIAINAGKVNVIAEVDNLETYSVVWSDDTNSYVSTPTAEIPDGENGVFTNGGTASYADKKVNIDLITPGDAVEFDIVVTNESTVAIKYQTQISAFEDDGLLSGLVVTIGDTELTTSGTTIASAWSEPVAANAEIDNIHVKIELPWTAGNDYKELSCELSVTLYAVQGNAHTTDPEDVDPDSLTIYNLNDLINFRNKVNGGESYKGETVVLMNNIDLASIENWDPIGTSQSLSFAGKFDGHGNTISNLKVTSGSYVGLFGYIGVWDPEGTQHINTEISDLVIDNATVTGSTWAAAFVAQTSTHVLLKDLKLTGHAEITATSWGAGGIVARNNYGTLENLTVEVDATSYVYASGAASGYQAGGIVGWTAEGNYTHQNLTSNVEVRGGYQVGGIVGNTNYGTKWINCVSTGDVKLYKSSATYADKDAIGGIAGTTGTNANKPAFDNCHYTGTLSSEYETQPAYHNYGLVGSTSCTITSSSVDVKTEGYTLKAEWNDEGNVTAVTYLGTGIAIEEVFTLASDVVYTFDNVNFTGNSYIVLSAGNSDLTVKNSKIDVTVTDKLNNWYSGFIIGVNDSTGATGTYDLTFEGNTVLGGGAGGVLFAWNAFKNVSIANNKFGSVAKPYDNSYEAVVKTLNAAEGGEFVASGNQFYISRTKAAGATASKVQVFDLYQNNSRANTYTAIFSGNTVYDVTAGTANATFYFAYVEANHLTATGNAQVFITADNTYEAGNTGVAVRAISGNDIGRQDNDSYKFVGWNISYDNGYGARAISLDGAKVASGKFALGTNFTKDDLKADYVAEGAGMDVYYCTYTDDNGDGYFNFYPVDGEETDTSYGVAQNGDWIIYDLDGLKAFATAVNSGNTFSGKTVKLAADIDLGGEPWAPIGGTYYGMASGSGALSSFAGTFDGAKDETENYTISNLYIEAALTNNWANSYKGLFGRSTGTIQNLNIHNAAVSGSLYVAAVVGNGNGTITNVHVTGEVKITAYWYAGTILGYGYAKIIGCEVSATAESESYVQINGGYVGGIVGFHGEGAIEVKNNTVENLTIINKNFGDPTDGVGGRIGGITGIAHYGNIVTGNTLNNVTIILEGAGSVDSTRIGAVAGCYLVSGTQIANISNNTGDVTVISTASAPLNNGVVGADWSAPPAGEVIVENNTVTVTWNGTVL